MTRCKIQDSRFKITHQKIQDGFTLMETVIVLAIFGLIATLAAFVSMDLYRGNSLNGQRDMLVRLLERARSQSMNNIDQSPHGLHVGGNQIVLFQGLDWQYRLSGFDVNFPVEAVVFSGLSDVVFDQLSGKPSAPGNIIITQNGRQLVVSINSQGQIAW